MMRVIDQSNYGPITVKMNYIDRRIVLLYTPYVIQMDIKDAAQNSADGATVGNNHEGFIAVLGYQLVNSPHGPVL